MPRRNIMRQFTLAEISAVDKPAQEAAKAVIIKRDMTALTDAIAKRWIDPADGAVTFSTVLQNNMDDKAYCSLMESYGPTVNALETSLRSIVGDNSLNSDTKLAKLRESVEAFMTSAQSYWPPDMAGAMYSAVSKGVSTMTTEIEKLQKQITELQASLKKSTDDGAAVTAKLAELETANKALVAAKAAADAEAEVLKAKGKMTAAERDYMDTLAAKDGDSADAKGKAEKAQKDFLGMTPEQRTEVMKVAKAGDESVTIDGQEVRKSVVGAATFAVLKSQAARVESLEKANKEETARRETAEFSKRADELFKDLPGSTEHKVEILRAIGKAEKPIQDSFEKMVKAGGAAIATAFKSLGHQGGKPAGSDDFDKRVSEVAKRDGISRTAAMEKARHEYPTEFAAYQGTAN